MADLVITPASVVKGSNARTENMIAGATVTAGQLVYKDESDSDKAKLVDSDSGTAAARSVYGIALNGASSGQPLQVHRGGQVTLGAILTAGTIYVASDTAGGIMPAADLETGDYVSTIGVAISTSVLDVQIHNSGVAV